MASNTPQVVAFGQTAGASLTFRNPIDTTNLPNLSDFAFAYFPDGTTNNPRAQFYATSIIVSSPTNITVILDRPLPATGILESYYFDPTRSNDLNALQAPGGDDVNSFVVNTTLQPLPPPQPPRAPSAPTLTPATDSGALDGTTNDPIPVVSGTANPGNTVRIYDAAGNNVATGVADQAGIYAIPLTIPFDVVATITATQTDSNGLTSNNSAPTTFTIDRTAPPDPAFTELSFASDSGISSNDRITNIQTPLVRGYGTPFATVNLYDTDGTTLLGTSTADSFGDWSITSAALADGTHTLIAKEVDLAGNASPGRTETVTIDTTTPTVALSLDQTGGTAIATFLYNEPVFGNPNYTFTNGGLVVTGGTLGLPSVNNTNNTNISAVFTPPPGVNNGTATLVYDNTSFIDVAGNPGVGTSSTSLTFDTLAPTATSIARVGNATNNAAAQQFTVTFSEAVTGVDASDFTLATTGSAASTGLTIAGNGATYTITANGVTGEGTLRLDLNPTATGIADLATNLIATGYATGQTYTLDHTRPGLAAIARVGAATNNATTQQYTVTFDEAVTGVTLSSFTLATTGTAAGTIGSITGTGATYTVTVNNVAGDGTLRLDLKPTGTGITDPAGNAVLGVNPPGETYTIDRTGPTITTFAPLDPANTNANTLRYALNFSEPVTGVGTGSFTVSGGPGVSGTVASITGSGSNYVVTLANVTGEGPLQLNLDPLLSTITDAAGNALPSGMRPGLPYLLDHLAPAVPGIPGLGAGTDTGLSTTDGITRINTPGITGTAEPGSTITLFDTNGITVLGTAVAATDGSYAITATPLAEGTHLLTTRATDPAGNVGPLSPPTTVVIDTTPPTLAISSSATQLRAGEASTVTFAFSEDPGASFNWNGTNGDVVVTGGTLGAISGTGLTRTATFTPTPGQNAATASITVAPGSYTDTAGNNGGTGSTPNITFDTLAPLVQSVTANPGAGALAAGETISFTVNASEALTITGAPALTLTDGSSAAYLSGSGTSALVFRITLAPGQNVNGLGIAGVNLPPGAAIRDAAGNNATLTGAIASFPGLTIDTTAPTITAGLATDSGAADGLTNSPFLIGTGEPNGTVSIFLGTSVLGQVPVDATGHWQFTPALADGAYTFEVQQADAAGNTSSTTVAFRLDTTVPTLTVGLIPGNDPRRGITTLAGTADPGATIAIYDGQQTLGTATADGSGAWTYTPMLADGAYTLNVSSQNAAGTSTSRSIPLLMDVAGVSSQLPHPFLTLSVTNDDPAAVITLTATIKPASTGRFYDLGNGVLTPDGAGYVISGTAAQITADLHAVIFVPAPGQPAPSSAVGVLTGEVPGATLQDFAGNVLIGDPTLSRSLVGGTSGTAFLTQGGPTFVQGGAGHDTVSAVSGNVTVVSGTAGSLIGLGSGVALINGRGPDTIVGGAGSATIGAATGSLVGLGAGMALVSAAAGSTVVGGAGANTVGVRGEGILMFGGSGHTTFIGGTGSSTVAGGSGSATLFGGQGGGVLAGGAAGSNIIVAGQQATTLIGGGGNDVLFATGSGGDLLVAGSGNTTLQGGASSGNDTFFAGAGNTLIGLGAGQGTVFAGSGASTVVGGSGSTTYAVLNGHAGGTEQIIGFKLGVDKLALGGFADGEIVRALSSVTTDAGSATTAASTTMTLSDNTRITFMDMTSINARVFG